MRADSRRPRRDKSPVSPQTPSFPSFDAMPLLDLLNYRGMEREYLDGHLAGGTADLACFAEGVLRLRALETPVGSRGCLRPLSSLRRTFAAIVAMTRLICTDVCAD